MASVHDSIVRKHLLSEKEKTAKNRLFNKGGPPGKRLGNQTVPDEVIQTVRKQPTDANIDKQIEGFMKEMTAEVKKINSGKIVTSFRCCIQRYGPSSERSASQPCSAHE
jgi:hypothetical protein